MNTPPTNSSYFTTLPKRSDFLEHVKLATKKSMLDKNFQFAVLFINLDRFKMIHESLGPIDSDKILSFAAHKIEEALPTNSYLAHIGADSFLVLLQGIKDSSFIIRKVRHIQASLSQKQEVNALEFVIDASVGAYHGRREIQSPEEIVRKASIALHEAKVNGSGSYVLYNPKMHDTIIKAIHLETRLRRAIRYNQFELYYQPIQNVTTNTITSCEALVRWPDEDGKWFLPDEFIPQAEEAGLIEYIDDLVIATGCAQLHKWNTHIDSDFKMALNLSNKYITARNVEARIRSLLDSSKVDTQSIIFELSEKLPLPTSKEMIESLEAIKRLGPRIAIDDFGTGYSSMLYLYKLPANSVKIDKSFIDNIASSHESLAICKAVILLAKDIGLDVVAEGVETKEQYSILQSIGCDYMQGYYISKPLNAKDMEVLLIKQKQLRIDHAQSTLRPTSKAIKSKIPNPSSGRLIPAIT